MFVMDYYGHKLSNGVLFAHHLILDVPGGSSHLGYRRRVPLWHNPPMRVKFQVCGTFHSSANTGPSSSLVPHDKKGFEYAPVKRRGAHHGHLGALTLPATG